MERHAGNGYIPSIPLCGVTGGRVTRPHEVVNCPNCRVILNHVRRRYPEHARYTDWRANRVERKQAVDRLIADLHGGADD